MQPTFSPSPFLPTQGSFDRPRPAQLGARALPDCARRAPPQPPLHGQRRGGQKLLLGDRRRHAGK